MKTHHHVNDHELVHHHVSVPYQDQMHVNDHDLQRVAGRDHDKERHHVNDRANYIEEVRRP